MSKKETKKSRTDKHLNTDQVKTIKMEAEEHFGEGQNITNLITIFSTFHYIQILKIHFKTT